MLSSWTGEVGEGLDSAVLEAHLFMIPRTCYTILASMSKGAAAGPDVLYAYITSVPHPRADGEATDEAIIVATYMVKFLYAKL